MVDIANTSDCSFSIIGSKLRYVSSRMNHASSIIISSEPFPRQGSYDLSDTKSQVATTFITGLLFRQRVSSINSRRFVSLRYFKTFSIRIFSEEASIKSSTDLNFSSLGARYIILTCLYACFLFDGFLYSLRRILYELFIVLPARLVQATIFSLLSLIRYRNCQVCGLYQSTFRNICVYAPRSLMCSLLSLSFAVIIGTKSSVKIGVLRSGHMTDHPFSVLIVVYCVGTASTDSIVSPSIMMSMSCPILYFCSCFNSHCLLTIECSR